MKFYTFGVCEWLEGRGRSSFSAIVEILNEVWEYDTVEWLDEDRNLIRKLERMHASKPGPKGPIEYPYARWVVFTTIEGCFFARWWVIGTNPYEIGLETRLHDGKLYPEGVPVGYSVDPTFAAHAMWTGKIRKGRPRDLEALLVPASRGSQPLSAHGGTDLGINPSYFRIEFEDSEGYRLDTAPISFCQDIHLSIMVDGELMCEGYGDKPLQLVEYRFQRNYTEWFAVEGPPGVGRMRRTVHNIYDYFGDRGQEESYQRLLAIPQMGKGWMLRKASRADLLKKILPKRCYDYPIFNPDLPTYSEEPTEGTIGVRDPEEAARLWQIREDYEQSRARNEQWENSRHTGYVDMTR